MLRLVAQAGYVRRILLVVAAAVVVLAVAFSNSFGRAQPSGNYRPELPPPALSNGCWPLPFGVDLDFPYQVRSDGDVGVSGEQRRRLVMQFDLVDADTALRQVDQAFLAAGFDQTTSSSTQGHVFDKSGFGQVDVEVAPLPGGADDSIVRGTIVLELPATKPQSDSPVCGEPYSTKRFAPDGDDAS